MTFKNLIFLQLHYRRKRRRPAKRSVKSERNYTTKYRKLNLHFMGHSSSFYFEVLPDVNATTNKISGHSVRRYCEDVVCSIKLLLHHS